MKYIFIAGVPGSKWSSVTKNIYYSPSIDRSDYTTERTYWHDAPGTLELMHLGVYWDPGMEFGKNFDRLNEFSREELEAEFDRPFTGTGVRIIKSHVFCHHLEFIQKTWPDSPIVLVYRNDDAALGWWVKCGHFDITYPDYDGYYKNLKHMSKIIANQNHDLLKWWYNNSNSVTDVVSNTDLCNLLGIDIPSEEYRQNYDNSDIKVGLVKRKNT